MAFRDDSLAMRERMKVLEDELENLRDLPEQLAQLQAERDSLAKQLGEHKSRLDDKPSRSKRARESTRTPIGWATPSIIFGFYPAALAIGAIADGTLYFDEALSVETTLVTQLFEWSATLGFLLMGSSLLLIAVGLFMGWRGALRALDYWAAGSGVLVLSVAVAHTVFSGEVPWEIVVVYLMYPAVVAVAWMMRAVGRRTR